ncbi:unnamed protein product [Mytilus coruscus]|uniref:DUF7030 domain-containing protein n=1 Tax=Mytilus coruscus TaxID=42192 RepID=A0A6J8B4A6_MYTCO|nr:unnamed protein product [Mytilus coruscus]
MAFKCREDLVGKRFLSVQSPGKLKVNKICEWEWRSGFVRAVSLKDVTCPDLAILVEFDNQDWKRREWVRVHDIFQIFLVEHTVIWAEREDPEDLKETVYWPALEESGIDGWCDQEESGVDGWCDQEESGVDGWCDQEESGVDGWFDQDDSGVDSWCDQEESGVDEWFDQVESGVDIWCDQEDLGVDGWCDQEELGVDSWFDQVLMAGVIRRSHLLIAGVVRC